jgi:ketosteroid isomerase-like protein
MVLIGDLRSHSRWEIVSTTLPSRRKRDVQCLWFSETNVKSAKSIALVLVVVPVLAAPAAWGQGENPPASTKESGATSGHGMTAVEQTAKGSGESVEQQIKTLHEQSRQAALKGDASFLEKYLIDDYVGIGGDGRMITKDQDIQMRKSGAIKFEAIDERDLKVRVYGDTVIVNALASLKLTVDGKPISGDHRATFVWVKQKGNWKEASFQATRVAPARAHPGNNLGHDAPPSPF